MHAATSNTQMRVHTCKITQYILAFTFACLTTSSHMLKMKGHTGESGHMTAIYSEVQTMKQSFLLCFASSTKSCKTWWVVFSSAEDVLIVHAANLNLGWPHWNVSRLTHNLNPHSEFQRIIPHLKTQFLLTTHLQFYDTVSCKIFTWTFSSLSSPIVDNVKKKKKRLLNVRRVLQQTKVAKPPLIAPQPSSPWYTGSNTLLVTQGTVTQMLTKN